VGLIGRLLRRRRARPMSAEELAAAEREVGLYEPDAAFVGECPRCGADVFLSTEPESGWAYICASCAVEVLGRPEWAAFLWECCHWAGEQADSCRMSGCCHARWRREAGFRWRVAQRRAAVS
jgi:hypothetical protein